VSELFARGHRLGQSAVYQVPNRLSNGNAADSASRKGGIFAEPLAAPILSSPSLISPDRTVSTRESKREFCAAGMNTL
jgi:hypothetical protein